jgi:hypothetical protein
MKTFVCRLVLPALLLAATPGLTLASPLKVGTVGGESQMALMCPHCNTPIVGATTGDYTIGFSADLQSVKTGLAQVIVSVTDKSGAPVKDAKVVVTLSMPEHGHALKPLTAKSRGNGTYSTSATLVQMNTPWNAEVAVTTAKGETVKQVFTFHR